MGMAEPNWLARYCVLIINLATKVPEQLDWDQFNPGGWRWINSSILFGRELALTGTVNELEDLFWKPTNRKVSSFS
jgi:hypothetical protein